MPVKKNTTKKSKNSKKTIPEIEELKKVSDDLMKKVNKLKDKYDKLDSNTKKKIVFGIGAAAAVLGTAMAVKKSKKSKK